MGMSIGGLRHYRPDVFDEFGLEAPLDTQTAIDVIVIRCAELDLVASDGDYVKAAIGVWMAKNKLRWFKLADTLKLEYNAIENYDRKEDIERVVVGESRSSTTGNNYVSGINGGSGDADTPSSRSVNGGTGDSKSTETVTNRTHGNIGVTTSQQMIQSERDLWMWNLYDIIADEFAHEFCIMIY